MSNRKRARVITPTLELHGDQNVIGIRDIYEEGSSNGPAAPVGNFDSEPVFDLPELPTVEFIPFEEATKDVTRAFCKCYGCNHEFGKQAIAGKWPGMDAVWDAYNNNKGNMSLGPLCDIISRVQYEKIAKPLIANMHRREANGGAPVTEEELNGVIWPPEEVKAHITVHMTDPHFQIQNKLKMYEVLHVSVQDTTYAKQPDGTVRPDPLKVALMIKIDDQYLKLLNALKTLK